jgi:hypothetical protein
MAIFLGGWLQFFYCLFTATASSSLLKHQKILQRHSCGCLLLSSHTFLSSNKKQNTSRKEGHTCCINPSSSQALSQQAPQAR